MCVQGISLRSLPLPASSPMTTALTVSRMKAFRRRKRSTCSRVMVCRRRRVRSALCCRLSCSRCNQPTRPSRWPLSRRNRLFPWLLMVYLRGTEGLSGNGEDRRWLWGQGKGWTKEELRIQTPGKGPCPPVHVGFARGGTPENTAWGSELNPGRKGSRSPQSAPRHEGEGDHNVMDTFAIPDSRALLISYPHKQLGVVPAHKPN